MSLINDALKKAQKQRTGETPLAAMPGVGGESAARIAKRDKPVGFNALLLRLGLGAGAVLVLALGGWFALRSKPEPSAVSGQPSAVSSQPSSPAVKRPDEPAIGSATAGPPVAKPLDAPSVALAKDGQPAGQPASAFTLPVVVPPPPTPEPRPKTPEPKPASPPSSVLRPPSSGPAAPAQPPAKLEPRAITFIETLRIAGIRASATDSKVLMNDRVYRVGDIVEHELNLKLIGITANSLTFEDERGGRYTRQF